MKKVKVDTKILEAASKVTGKRARALDSNLNRNT